MCEDHHVGDAPTTSTRDSLVFRDERSREAIVDAMLGLYHRGVPDPTALEIADQAGVSLRSVYFHFADLESLALEAVGRQRAQIEPLLAPPVTTGSLDDRRRWLIGQQAVRRQASMVLWPFVPHQLAVSARPGVPVHGSMVSYERL